MGYVDLLYCRMISIKLFLLRTFAILHYADINILIYVSTD